MSYEACLEQYQINAGGEVAESMPEAAFVYFAAESLRMSVTEILQIDYNDVLVMLAYRSGQRLAEWRNAQESQ